MRKELEEKLVQEFPGLFKEYGGDKADTCMHWGCTHGDGWFSILWILCECITSHYQYLATQGKGLPMPKPFVFTQIKEKFGILTIYYDGGDDVVRHFVSFASALSYVTCELCGSTSNVHTSRTGWITVRCRSCIDADTSGRYPASTWKPVTPDLKLLTKQVLP